MKIKLRRLFVNTKDSDQYDPHDYGYDSWLEYWEAKMNHQFLPLCNFTCPACNKVFHKCDLVGGHVTDLMTEEIYITPICNGCNDKKQNLPPFHVDDKWLLPFKP